jgi:hypothetical protein
MKLPGRMRAGSHVDKQILHNRTGQAHGYGRASRGFHYGMGSQIHRYCMATRAANNCSLLGMISSTEGQGQNGK